MVIPWPICEVFKMAEGIDIKTYRVHQCYPDLKLGTKVFPVFFFFFLTLVAMVDEPIFSQCSLSIPLKKRRTVSIIFLGQVWASWYCLHFGNSMRTDFVKWNVLQLANWKIAPHIFTKNSWWLFGFLYWPSKCINIKNLELEKQIFFFLIFTK